MLRFDSKRDRFSLLTAKGASRAQARAALKQYKDVDQAAECIFDGKFDHIEDEEGDIEMDCAPAHEPKVKYVKNTDDF